MALPPNAKILTRQMDPADVVDFVANASPDPAGLDQDEVPLLEDSEIITSYTLTMSPEGAALGVTISTGGSGEGGAAPSLIAIVGGSQTTGATAVKFWLYVDATFQDNAAFDGTGTYIALTLTVNTNSIPSRRRQRTIVVQVAQQ
jgi:hypothetical protein